MFQEERKRKEKSWVHKFISPAQVAEAVGKLLVSGQPGEVITVGPGESNFSFTESNIQRLHRISPIFFALESLYLCMFHLNAFECSFVAQNPSAFQNHTYQPSISKAAIKKIGYQIGTIWWSSCSSTILFINHQTHQQSCSPTIMQSCTVFMT